MKLSLVFPLDQSSKMKSFFSFGSKSYPQHTEEMFLRWKKSHGHFEKNTVSFISFVLPFFFLFTPALSKERSKRYASQSSAELSTIASQEQQTQQDSGVWCAHMKAHQELCTQTPTYKKKSRVEEHADKLQANHCIV